MSQAIPADVRERIIQAAQELYEQNGRETMPTVDAVRRTARVDMNAASAVMREWRRSQTAQVVPVAVTVPEVVTQANSAALAALWRTAQELANESLRAAKATWETERAEADHDRQELADAYERQATELEEVRAAAERSTLAHQAQQDARTQELAIVRVELATATTRAERAEARAQEIEQRAADLHAELDRAHLEADRLRDEIAAAMAEMNRAKEVAATLRAELKAASDRADERVRDAEQRIAAVRTEAEATHADLRAALAAAQESAAEARERAAALAGKLEAEQAHCAALLARLDAPAPPEAESKATRTTRTKKEPKA